MRQQLLEARADEKQRINFMWPNLYLGLNVLELYLLTVMRTYDNS